MLSRRPPTESGWLYALAAALMIAGPLWHYLYVNRYPFARPEAIILPLAIGVAAAALAAAAHRAGGLLEGLVFGCLLFVFIDLQFDLDKWIYTAVIVAGCFGLTALIRSRRAMITCLTLGAFYLSSLVRPSAPSPVLRLQSDSRQASTLPVLVHLVLDEQWGIGGLRAAGDTATAAFLRDFYLSRGFEVYDAAYSRWVFTHESIPDLMSLGGPVAVEALPRFEFRLRANPYFRHLHAMGYAIHVYQSTALDYCHSADAVVDSCEVVPAVSIANIGHLDGAWTIRAVLAARFFLNMTSHVYARLHPDPIVWRRGFAGRGLAELEDARHAIAAGLPGGSAIFIHLLLPHRPLEVDEACRAYADPGRRVNFGEDQPLSDSAWHERLSLYAAQVRCVHRAVDRLLAALDSTVGRDGSIVIVHGDHGSRMSQQSPAGIALFNQKLSSLNGQQINSAFSTLLAIRRPRMSAALHSQAVPLQDFFWQLVKNDFRGEAGAGWNHYVRRMKSDSVPVDTLRALTADEMVWPSPSPVR